MSSMRTFSAFLTIAARASLICGVFLLILLTKVNADTGKDNVVLITAKGSGIQEMAMRDIRRVYLGLKSVDSVRVKTPVLNVQSRHLYDEFLKNTMHMTEGSYKRKLVKRMFRQGGSEIEEMSTLETLNQYLLDHAGSISFVGESAVSHMQDVEVIQILW